MLQTISSFSKPIRFPGLVNGETAKGFPLIALPLILGILIGACVGSFSSTTDGFLLFLSALQYTPGHTGLVRAIFLSVRFPLLALLIAFTLYGVLLIPALSAMRGFLLGCSVAAAFQAGSWRELMMAGFTVGIPALLGVPAFVLACVDSVYTSAALLHFFLRGERSVPEAKPIHLFRAVFVLALCALEAIYSGCLLPVILRFLA